MPKVELVYFSGCPNIEVARNALSLAGVIQISEVNLSVLDVSHPYQRFSSPSILIDGAVLAGSENDSPSCSVVDWRSLVSKMIDHLKRSP